MLIYVCTLYIGQTINNLEKKLTLLSSFSTLITEYYLDLELIIMFRPPFLSVVRVKNRR